MLFVIVADVLQVLMSKTSEVVLGAHPSLMPSSVYQYADDTVIIADAHPANIQSITLTLDIFAKMSGLHVNHTKSSFIPIALNQHQSQTVARMLGFQCQSFPITYLGLPLSIKAPKKADFFPLVERVQQRLAGWQASMLSIAGRLVLLKSTLSALPLHYMQAFMLPS